MQLENQIIAISGATGGLGQVAVRSLAESGAKLALLSTNQKKLDKMVAEIGIDEDRVLVQALDLRLLTSSRIAVRSILDKFGRLDALVHVIGGWVGGTLLMDLSPDQLEEMLQQHVWTTFYLLKEVVPLLINNGWGRVIIISSPTAESPTAKSAAYAAAKAAQEALLLSLAQEVKNTGITVNILRVKTIDSEHQREKSPTTANAAWTTPEEIVSTIRFLLSDEASRINGARIPLYGSP
jgi:NAD(P)-dependent dehydrogenase (short-subunit alcohol dehydrogenase family)